MLPDKGTGFNFSIGNRVRLAAKARASLNTCGILLLSKTGMVYQLAPLLKKTRRTLGSGGNEIFKEIIVVFFRKYDPLKFYESNLANHR